ncbi:hypothetical protein [Moraxella atlantae]|uniref:LPD3 domain-containing protein n=1 Tax=Faucicola atlantae TaxID=34059 RepID=UPI0011C02A63|nr:hypothetical protein [Moraxella atlantae]
MDELQRLLLAQQTDVLTDDDIEQLSKIDIDDTQDMGQGARKRTAKDWIRDNLLGKTVKTIDGKVVHFNSKDTIGHITYNVKRNDILVKCLPYIPQIFAKGEFMGRELSDHDRADKSIIAFHPYRKWVELKNGYKVFAEVQACERENESDLFYAGYNLKALKKVASPSHFDSVMDNTKWLSLGFMATFNGNNSPQFDKLQDDITTNDVLPLLILMVKDEAGKVVYDLEKGIDDLAEGWELQATQTPIFNRQGVKPTNRNGNVDMRARQKANDEAIALLNKIQNEGLTRDDLTTEQLTTLAKYTGNGGGIVNHEGKTGSQYEYYTPMELASSMWDLARELGFNGGRVLDPSAGTGVFTATSPDNAIIDSVELDRVSGGIAIVLGLRSGLTVLQKESPHFREGRKSKPQSIRQKKNHI